jgi:hypothetical protein
VISAQRYLADYDSSLFIRDTLRPFLRRFENLHFSAYMQPQFQVAQEKGVASFAGGNFSEHTNNRFMLRRARVKMDYLLPAKDNVTPKALFTFQFEATERDVNIRDMFVRVFEPKHQNFSFTMGLFARPFGYEVNLSSSYRETPERGRASQTLMPSERDLGAMITFERLKRRDNKPLIKFDLGVFNGQGKSGTAEFDVYKDFISRIYLKPQSDDKRNFFVSGGLSFLYGGWRQATQYKYEIEESGNNKAFVLDSNLSNIGDRATRNYYGGDVQLVHKHDWGKTELRGEYWRGKQPGTNATTVNPGTLPAGPTYIRNFDAAFFYFLQNIVNENWELMAKYDWYDPNTKVEKEEIGKQGTNLDVGDIKYNTLGIGLTRYFTDNLKFLVYYDIVKNEKTQLPGFTHDLKDNVFTFRIQMRF